MNIILFVLLPIVGVIAGWLLRWLFSKLQLSSNEQKAERIKSEAIKEAGNVWAVPVIDLNSICGLYPNTPSHARYFHKKDTDLLHPNAEGHEKMAYAIAYALRSISPR